MQLAGAAAAIVVNNLAGGAITMVAAVGGNVAIPALMISMEDGNTLKEYMLSSQARFL